MKNDKSSLFGGKRFVYPKLVFGDEVELIIVGAFYEIFVYFFSYQRSINQPDGAVADIIYFFEVYFYSLWKQFRFSIILHPIVKNWNLSYTLSYRAVVYR